MANNYKKEFFDRDYTVREAYRRIWKYAKRYKARLLIGIICGMLTAGTLVPFFQAIQPALEKVSTVEQMKHKIDAAMEDPSSKAAPAQNIAANQNTGSRAKSKLERQMQEAAKLPAWYPKVEKLAGKLGIKLESDDGGMGGALVLLIIVVIPLVAFLRLILIFLNHYCLTWAGMRAVADLRCEMLKHVQNQSMQFFGRVDVGQLMSRISGDPQQIQTILTTILTEVAQAPFEICVAVGFIIWFAISNEMLPTLLIIALGFPLFMFPIVILGKTIKKWARRSLERGSVISSNIHEVLTCIKVVKSYHTEELENRKYYETNRNFLKSALRAVRLGLLVGPTVETVGILLICAFVMWCFIAHISLANVVPMLAPLLLIYKPIKQLSKLQVQVENSLAALSRIYSVLDYHAEIPESENAVSKQEFSDRIVFNDVSFRYDTADKDAVSNASFEIPRGKLVAVVGGTGSGKSTMSGLIARFYDPQSGAVTMDGIDLRNIKIADVRNLIGAVMQETILFNDTVEENIRYGTPGATHEEVVAAAKMANAHDFIMAQPGGYSRVVGEKGFSLSGGERQRIAIARAILKNPPILILDEATSALDTVTERLVQDAINNLMSNRTTFAIAHRLSTIRNADLILVMEQGRIIERGTHDELYNANGAYRKLCDMQHTD